MLPAFLVFVATGALIVLTGTGAAANQPGRSRAAANPANLAAPAALDSYLRSIGVSRASLVTQRGARNYAGPNCPGKGWSCTTSTRVLQIAKGDGQNKVDCTAGSIVTGSSQSCTIVQTGANNSAKCQQRSDSDAAVQYCSITQTGTNNRAHVQQIVHAENFDEQTAKQTALVKQTSAGGSNESNVHQDVNQKAKEKDASSQSQDVQQSTDVDQTATGAGSNRSTVHQDQDLSAKGSAATQNQNTLVLGVPDCVFGAPFSPNGCANISQSSGTGNNESRIKQSIKEDAKSTAVAIQRQGSFSGGLEGAVHQVTSTPGSSSSDAKQSKDQDANAAPGSFQNQIDPLSCCGAGSQVGGTGNHEQIDQSSDQAASEVFAFQDLQLLGSSRSPTGSCSVSQAARNNADSTTNSASESPCLFLILETSCFNGGGEGEGGGFCTASAPITTPPGCGFNCNTDTFAKPTD